MHVNRMVRLSLLATVSLVLAACTLPFGQATETPTPTPTLIIPAVIEPTTPAPPSETPVTETPTPTPTLEITATPVPTTPAGPTTHTVLRGEWIYAIARIYGIDPEDLIAANPGVQGNPDLVYPDQQLSLPGVAPATTPAPPATAVAGPTAGPASLPMVDRAVYQALLEEDLPPLSGACPTAVSPTLTAAWELDYVQPRLGCPTAEASSITGSWMEFGPGSRIIWLREPAEFHAITGAGFGQRWVFEDESGLADAPLLVRPDGSSAAFTPTGGRYGWLLNVYPEISSLFSPAFGDENAIIGTYQTFDHGAILYDGALRFVFFDDSGPWWVLAQ